MATFLTSNAVGEREDLSDVIYRIDPDETPVFSNAAKETTKAVTHDWQVQELASAADDNHVNEGADFSYVNPTATTRLSNVHQIAAQAASVSNTLDTVDKAGRDRETAYVKIIKAIEQRRDIEKGLFKNEAKDASDPRKTAKFLSYMSNVVLESGSSVASGGDGGAAATMSGSNDALELADIEGAMKLAYEDGGQPDMLVLSPANKVAFSNLSSGSVATNQIQMTAPAEAAIVGSVSLFLTDFGTLNAVIDRNATNTEILLLDSDHYAIGHLPGRMFSVSDVAATGDATKFAIISEYVLINRAPKAHAAIFDLNTS